MVCFCTTNTIRNLPVLPALKSSASLSSVATQLPWAGMSSGSVGAVCSQEGAVGFLHFSAGRTRCLAARKRKANIKISNKVVLFSPWPCVGVSLRQSKLGFFSLPWVFSASRVPLHHQRVVPGKMWDPENKQEFRGKLIRTSSVAQW